MNGTVFISYARTDSDFVALLADALAGPLKQCGLSAWIDQRNILPGDDWDRAIDDAIRDCVRFLIVLSPAATVSEHSGEVRGELRLALGLQKEIVPVLHQPCEIPRQLLHTEYVDCTAGLDGRTVERLAAALCGIRPPEAPPSDRIGFIGGLRRLPEDARAFDREFSREMAIDLSGRLSDAQFKALRDLKQEHDSAHGARGIVRSLALECIGGQEWDAAQVFDVLIRFGFLALSSDPKERNHPDPGYDYTPLFFGYTNLQGYLGCGASSGATDKSESDFWLSPRNAD
jgi:hypothetical protein